MSLTFNLIDNTDESYGSIHLTNPKKEQLQICTA